MAWQGDSRRLFLDCFLISRIPTTSLFYVRELPMVVYDVRVNTGEDRLVQDQI